MNAVIAGVGFGLTTAAIVAMAAVAFSLQFSVTRVPNFAHGEFITFGAYGAFLAQSVAPNIFLGAAFGITLGGLVAWLSNRFVLQPFIKIGTRPIYLLVVTAGLSQILQNGIAFFMGEQTRLLQVPASGSDVYHIGPVLWTKTAIVVMITSVIAVALVYALLRYTRFGKAQRAVADRPELATISGINVPLTVDITWIITGMLAGLAGVCLAAVDGSMEPTLGFSFLLLVFSAAIVGGIGKPLGALAGALVVGVATEVAAVFINSNFKVAFAIGFLILTLLFRPNGLFASGVEVI